jgi:murein L,D-transpeptidase YcbB/YkuD
MGTGLAADRYGFDPTDARRRHVHVAPMRPFAAANALVLGAIAVLAFPARAAGAQSLHVEVNVPAYTLDVLRGDTLVRQFRVAIGLRSDPTPIGNFAITEITWNPWWHPPHSEWAKKDTTMPPGPVNPMGVVKLLIGGLYYVHGTPIDASIGRAASHGCMRMHQADAVELASLLLSDQEQSVPSWSDADSTPLEARTVLMVLRHPVPILTRYATMVIHGDSVTLYPDVYRRSVTGGVDEAIHALAESQVDTAGVDRVRLVALLKRSARRRVTVPLSSIGIAR